MGPTGVPLLIIWDWDPEVPATRCCPFLLRTQKPGGCERGVAPRDPEMQEPSDYREGGGREGGRGEQAGRGDTSYRWREHPGPGRFPRPGGQSGTLGISSLLAGWSLAPTEPWSSPTGTRRPHLSVSGRLTICCPPGNKGLCEQAGLPNLCNPPACPRGTPRGSFTLFWLGWSLVPEVTTLSLHPSPQGGEGQMTRWGVWSR